MEIALSFGSNLGDRLANFRLAKILLDEIPKVRTLELSPLYETDPVDVSEEYRNLRFLNAIVLIDHPDVDVLAPQLWEIERTMGRPDLHGHNTPRTIDIDIIYAGDLKICNDRLTLPHARWVEREFVVRPLCDVRPERVVMGQSRSVQDILLSLPAGGGVVPFCGAW